MSSGASQPGHAVVAAVLGAVHAEREAVASGDIDQYLGVLTDDAIFMPPNSVAKAGAELREWLRAFLADVQVEWLSFVSTEVLVFGTAAYHAFTYTWRVCPRSGGEAKLASGKGVHLLELQVGGWRIRREIWNASPTSVR
jgi:ketosteroid isomerase-like protein